MDKTRVAYKDAFGEFPPKECWVLKPKPRFSSEYPKLAKSPATDDSSTDDAEEISKDHRDAVDEKIEPLK